MKVISKLIQDHLNEIGEPQKARWLEGYVKHDVHSKGVPLAKIRSSVREMEKEYALSEYDFSKQSILLNDLMSQIYTEDKMFVILYLQEFWNEKYHAEKLKLIESWLDAALITDWNVCDWLCLKVLTPILRQAPKLTIETLTAWNQADFLWKARASLVPFTQIKPITKYKTTIENFASKLIQRPERFCKTAVGWVLREYSKFDALFVTQFLASHHTWITPEVKRNATKYIDKVKV